MCSSDLIPLGRGPERVRWEHSLSLGVVDLEARCIVHGLKKFASTSVRHPDSIYRCDLLVLCETKLGGFIISYLLYESSALKALYKFGHPSADKT